MLQRQRLERPAHTGPARAATQGIPAARRASLPGGLRCSLLRRRLRGRPNAAGGCSCRRVRSPHPPCSRYHYVSAASAASLLLPYHSLHSPMGTGMLASLITCSLTASLTSLLHSQPSSLPTVSSTAPTATATAHSPLSSPTPTSPTRASAQPRPAPVASRAAGPAARWSSSTAAPNPAPRRRHPRLHPRHSCRRPSLPRWSATVPPARAQRRA